jgi:CBS domain-containing protein/anti-sigma regulatory factor (Ser/Thr protein kinase)
VVSDKEVTRVQELAYELKVEEVMTTNVITISPKANMGELREILRSHRISGVPVINRKQLVGLVSMEDLIKCLADGQMDALVEDKMTKKAETLYADEPLTNAVSKFNQSGFGRFPVIERNHGKLVGMLTKGDMVRGLLKRLESEYHQEESRIYRASHIFEDITADKASIHLQYNVASRDIKKAGESASGLKKALTRLGFPPNIVRRVTIAAYEAEMNIVIYTNGGQISADIEPDVIKLEAKDSGPGIPDIEQAMQPGFSTAQEWVRELGFGAGMGLPNIKKCADEMTLTSDVDRGTDLKVTIYTHKGQ